MKDTIKKMLETQTKPNSTTAPKKLISPCFATDVQKKSDLLVLTNIELAVNEGVCRGVKIRGRELQHLYCLKTWDKHVGEWTRDNPSLVPRLREKKQKWENGSLEPLQASVVPPLSSFKNKILLKNT